MIQKIKVLGKGGNGEVWLGKMSKHTNIAIKTLLNKTDEAKIKIMKEVEIMEKVRHPKLISNYGFWLDEKKDQNGKVLAKETTWVIDLLPGGDLYELIYQKSNLKKLSIVERFIILKEIAIGIQGFHLRNIVHRDIKPENVLFTEEVSNEKIIISAKLADYGESVDLNNEKMVFIRENKDKLDDNLTCENFIGTIKYAPCEIIAGDLKQLSLKSDIYSFGILIWEMFTEERPLKDFKDEDVSELALEAFYEGSNEREENGKIVEIFPRPLYRKSGEKIPFISETPKEIEELIEKCLEFQVERRPEIGEIIEELTKIEEKYNFTYTHG